MVCWATEQHGYTCNRRSVVFPRLHMSHPSSAPGRQRTVSLIVHDEEAVAHQIHRDLQHMELNHPGDSFVLEVAYDRLV